MVKTRQVQSMSVWSPDLQNTRVLTGHRGRQQRGEGGQTVQIQTVQSQLEWGVKNNIFNNDFRVRSDLEQVWSANTTVVLYNNTPWLVSKQWRQETGRDGGRWCAVAPPKGKMKTVKKGQWRFSPVPLTDRLGLFLFLSVILLVFPSHDSWWWCHWTSCSTSLSNHRVPISNC